MIAWFALLVPVIMSLLAFVIFHKDIKFGQIFIPVIATAIVIFVMKWSMASSLEADTEFLSEFPVSAAYYEEWDEWIEETCSDTTCDSKGENCTTTYYDCSYRRRHSAYWEVTMNTGSVKTISQSYYQMLVKLWSNETFVDMHRDFYEVDGDAYTTKWTGKFDHIRPWDWSQTYSNKPQTLETVFHFNDLSPDKRKHVYDYPVIVNSQQSACLGCTAENNMKLRRINALLGYRKQVHVFVLLFKDQSVNVAELQRQHWKGGNKNELVICADVDGKWSRTFSWVDDKTVEVKANAIFTTKESVSNKLSRLYEVIDKHWKRKEFKDFSYIDVQLTTKQLIWITIISFITSILSIVGILHFNFSINNSNKWR
jgi:hypothetical protein